MQGVDADAAVARIADRILHRRRRRNADQLIPPQAEVRRSSREGAAAMSEAPVQPDRSPHVVTPYPSRPGPSRGSAPESSPAPPPTPSTSPWPSLVVAAGYLSWCAALFVIDAPGFSFPKPSFLFLLGLR